MLVLFETAAGYAIFKLNDCKLSEIGSLYEDFQSPEKVQKLLKLKLFRKFQDTSEALNCSNSAAEGKLNKFLKATLKEAFTNKADKLLVADSKLGVKIKEKMNIPCISDSNVQELMRCIRSQAENLLQGLEKKEMSAMVLGLAHSLCRYKLKFSNDKVDTMIIQSICLLDDLDKEINNYVMRCREWYGWHFPELSKLVPDGLLYAKIIKLIGSKENFAKTDLTDLLPEKIIGDIQQAAETSMGTEITELDVLSISNLCTQIIELTAYKSQLDEYLASRMMALAPNVTILVGEQIGARMITKAGSLINLAKQPSSTVQLYGAEKALFSALKANRGSHTKSTPKYGILYHSTIIANSNVLYKGKMSRSLAAKLSLASRVDALGEEEDEKCTFGIENKSKLMHRLQFLQQVAVNRSGRKSSTKMFEKFRPEKSLQVYDDSNDLQLKKRKLEENDDFDSTTGLSFKRPKLDNDYSQVEIKEEPGTEYNGFNAEKTSSKKKKKKSQDEVKVEEVEEEEEETEEPAKTLSKKKKKKNVVKVEEVEEEETEEPAKMSSKKKKKKHVQDEEEETEEPAKVSSKKKKKNVQVEEVEDTEEPAKKLAKKKKKKLSKT